ncbi:MAG: hypothetical protein AAF721_20005 [Myxococcota bacterium]
MAGALCLGVALFGCDEGSESSDDGNVAAGTGDDDGDADTSGEPGDDDSADAAADSESGGESGGDGSDAVGFATDVAPILAASCSCHMSATPSAGLDLTEGAAYGALVEADTPAGLTLVVPGDASASYLVNKLEGTQADVGGAGGQMPPGGALPPDALATVIAWIDAGAAE